MSVLLTVDKTLTRHGFTITNNSTESVTVLVLFTASAASEIGPLAARRNLESATDTERAGYGEDWYLEGSAVPSVATYQSLWSDDFSYTPPRAHRTGSATFVLVPGAWFKFWQQGLSLFGSPQIIATVHSIAVGDGPMEEVEGDIKTLNLP